MREHRTYGTFKYSAMALDRVRTDAYADALRRTITPDSVVVDIGCGTGIFSLLACGFGARRVFAIELDDCIDVARRIAADNGLEERIEFIQDRSINVELPEPADVVVSDLRGTLPYFDNHLHTIIDARDRLLDSQGTLIPRRDTLWAAIVEHPLLYDVVAIPPPERTYGFDLSAGFAPSNGRMKRGQAELDQLLSRPATVMTLDYTSVDTVDGTGDVTLAMRREGTAHGVLLWFDAELVDGVGFSTGPGNDTMYDSEFFPFVHPVAVEPNDLATLRLHAKHVVDDYWWRWSTRLVGADGTVRAEFDQSELEQLVGSVDALERTVETLGRLDEHRVVELNEPGRIAGRVLSLLAGGELSQGEVASMLACEFPNRFTHWKEALVAVAEIAEEYGRRGADR